MRGFINAKLYQREEIAFLVDDEGTFVTFGNNADILAQLEENDESVDLKGAYVVPGFIDAGAHLLDYGYRLNHTVHLERVGSLEEILSRIRGYLYNGKAKEWIIASGYKEENIRVGILPNKRILDTITNEFPIVLCHASAREMIVNSKALEMAGIAEDSYVEGGFIDFESGILKESACNIMQEAMPKASEEEITEAILSACKEYNRYGITTVSSSDFAWIHADYKTVLDAFMKLSYQEKLTVRVSEQCEFQKPEDFAEFLDAGYTTGVGDDFFEIGPLKITMDGTLDIHTASLNKPYADEPDNRGIAIYTKEELRTLMNLAFEYNMPCLFEAHGDQAIKDTLAVYSKAALEGNPLGYGLMNMQVFDDSILKKIKEWNLDFYENPAVNQEVLQKRLGSKRQARASSLPDTLVSVGMQVMEGIESLVTKESFSIMDAIQSYTENSSRALRMNAPIGMLKEEYKADFTVLDNDLTTINPKEIPSTKVLMCVVDGKTVFE